MTQRDIGELMLRGVYTTDTPRLARLLTSLHHEKMLRFRMFQTIIDVITSIPAFSGDNAATAHANVATQIREIADMFFPDPERDRRDAELGDVVEEESKRTYGIQPAERNPYRMDDRWEMLGYTPEDESFDPGDEFTPEVLNLDEAPDVFDAPADQDPNFDPEWPEPVWSPP